MATFRRRTPRPPGSAAARPAAGGVSGAPARPEHWRLDAGEADVATLVVPAALGRDRVFEIDLRFVVRSPNDAAPAGAEGPWLAVTLDLDGAQAWQRRIPAECPGQTDSLDYHCRRVVPEGQALRLRAVTRVGGGVRRLQLRLDAEEVGRDD